MKHWLTFLLFISLDLSVSYAQPPTRVKKMVLQTFWWDYQNNNFPNGWANYLTELAPRLKDMGVDAVWIPPTVKNQDFGQKGVGYAPFDHYDLGDKFQKKSDTTRVGTKDELLRMVAVLHANGIEVIQDIVPNHIIGAGSDTGGGGQDPAAPVAPCTDNWKNFRYACYKTPATDQSAADYLAREGRFPKNHQNFHPSPLNNCNLCDSNGDPICWQGFGPDADYTYGAYGLSSNATYNPDQLTYSPYNNGGIGTPPNLSNGYLRKHTREWLIWYKKQMGFDGVRIDAVKHFPSAASEDFLYNLQQNAGWASGGDKMFAVGEYVGGAGALDAWMASVQNRSGTFDFNLRAFHNNGTEGLRSMIHDNTNGTFDLGLLPGAQQGNSTGTGRWIDINNVRIHRTVPFINNHDTYRPCYDANGNIIGWKDGANCAPSCRQPPDNICPSDELSRHVDTNEPRLAAAYAAMCAMDGNPQVFFEDLLNVANTGKRWTHLPTSTTDLPANQDIANIMKAHGALNFKGGDYKVRSAEPGHYNAITGNTSDNDHLIIERSNKAVIAVTDQWNQDQESWIDTDFAPGTVLVDYSGGITTTSVVQGDKRANIKTRAVGYPSFTYSDTYGDHGAFYHGYSIWAPQGIDFNGFSNAPIPTTQEWEMENDLGDSHCQSLTQGGRTPDNSPNARIVGKIFVAANTTIAFVDSLGTPSIGQTIEFYDNSGNRLFTANGSGTTITGTFVNDATRWVAIKVRNTAATGPGQKCWVKMTYTAPAVVNTASFPAANTVSIWTSNGGSANWNDCKNWEEGKIPTCAGSTAVIPHAVKFMPTIDPCFTGTFINRAGLSLSPKIFLQGPFSGGAGTMNDGLRLAGVIPTNTPYGGSESTTAAVLNVSGNNAIVDWVKIELRDKNAPASVLETRSALVQRDGDVVGTDGISPVFFNSVATDDYYIAIRHRNHFGFRTAAATPLGTAIFAPNFTNNSVPLYGTNPLRNLGGVYVMYSADANGDGVVNAIDRNAHWRLQNGGAYNYNTSTADFNLDATVNAIDRNAHWRVNNSLIQWLD